MLNTEVPIVLWLPYNVAIKEGFKERRGKNFMLGVLAQGLELASTSCVQLLKDMHDGEIDLVVI